MDIIITEDRCICTETVVGKSKDSEEVKKALSSSGLSKAEKKKSENKKLKKRLNEIEEQNDSLAKLINDKNNEILDLKKSVNSLNDILNSVPISELRYNASIASTKLLELSKKNRQLRVELETTKNNLSRKDQQVRKLEKDLQEGQIKAQQNKELLKNSSPSHAEELQAKLSALQQKLFETRNKNLELHTQLKLAQKCLQQEIGESFNLNLLAHQAGSSGWRGRAQQILHLQQKVKELQEKLDGNNKDEINHQNSLCCVNPSLCSSTSFGSIERPKVRKTEIQHRAKVESLEKEIINLKSDLEDHRAKILALKVRNKTLNDEILRYKQKASSLEELTDFNSLNVATINEKLNEQKSYYEKKLNEVTKEANELYKEKQEMELNREHLEEKIKELQSLILEKDDSIKELNALVKKLEQDLKAICGDFLFSCRELRKEEFLTILDSLEAEKNSLLDLNKTHNERLTQERLKNDSFLEQVSKQKIRISRLEAKLRDAERELEVQTEKKKRSQRIAEYTANLNSINSASSLSSFTFENTSLMATVNNIQSQQPSIEDVNDLKNRLELSTEKIAILKEKLDYISAEKENDIKTFHEIISNSKTILLEMITAHHQNNNGGGPVQLTN